MVTVATAYQFELQCIVAHPDVTALADLRDRKVQVSAQGRSSYWPWMKQKFGLTDAQSVPYTGNFQQFIADKDVAVGGIISSEPYRIESTGQKIHTLSSRQGWLPALRRHHGGDGGFRFQEPRCSRPLRSRHVGGISELPDGSGARDRLDRGRQPSGRRRLVRPMPSRHYATFMRWMVATPRPRASAS